MTPAPLPPEEIERLKTLLAEATEGPWMLGADHERIILEWRDQHGTMRPDAYTRNGWAKTIAKVSEASWRPIQQQVADGRLLAAAVNALPALLAEIEAGRAGADRVPGLTFDALRQANIARIPTFRDPFGRLCHTERDQYGPGADWSIAEWLQAVTGELGELANLLKKVRRGDKTMREAHPEIRRELADVQTYLDILALRLGVDLGDATTDKFNEVSERVGSPVRLEA